MNIPTYVKQVNQENYHEQLNQVMQSNLSDNGFVIPSQTTANINTLVGMGQSPYGTVWYNTDLNKLVVLTPSGVQTIQSI